MRAFILETARRLADRDGLETLTLSAVAAEANIARATIYGYFSGKRDLLSQVSQTAAGAEEAAPAETPEAPSGVEEAVSGEPVGENYQGLMQAQADALHQIAQRVIVPKSLMKDGTGTVLSRVEARLSVVEQTTAALERRLEEQAKDFADRIAATNDTLQRLMDRQNAFERRQQEVIAELRLSLHNLKETVAKQTAPTPVPDGVMPEPEPVLETPCEAEPEEEPEPDTVSPTPAIDNYLSTARRAAISAALAVEEEEKKLPGHLAWLPKLHIRNKRRFWLILVLAALAVGVFDIFAFSVYSPRAATRSEAAAAPAKPATPPSVEVRASRGDAEAQLVLGMRLLNGTGVAMNMEKSAYWLERAAVAGQPVAQNLVGVLYQTGTGVTADMAKAIGWYEAAAGQGNVKAMANLGKVYAGGWAEGIDFEKSALWFSRAAALGDVDAQFDLAILHELGQGVSRSIFEAYKWYAVAAAQGDQNAKARASLLAARLTPEELEMAQQTIAAFKPGRIVKAANETPPASG